MRKRFSLGTLLAAAALGSACVPNLPERLARDPSLAVAPSFEGGTPSDGTPKASAASEGQRSWSDFFPNRDLIALIDGALKSNQELDIRLQEVIIAETEVSIRRGEYLPRLDATAGVGVEHPSENSSRGASDRASGVPGTAGVFGFGLRASWEVDAWGRMRTAANAATARVLASQESVRLLVTQLVAELARSFYELAALDKQIEVIERTVELQTAGLEAVRAQKQAARVTELAVQRFEAELIKNRSRVFGLRQLRTQTENRVNFLIGRMPQPIVRGPDALDTPIAETLHTGIPTDLLDNRPDLRRARLELEAAKLDVVSARASFYPSIRVEAGAGYEAFNAEHLLSTPESVVFGAIGGLTAPLLNRAAIKAQYRASNARQVQAVFAYERGFLQAYTEVANALSKLANLKRSYDLTEQQVTILTSSIDVSNLLFQSARADYMEVLLTRRDALDAQLELIETKKRLLLSVVDLYEALGGGWRETTASPSEAVD